MKWTGSILYVNDLLSSSQIHAFEVNILRFIPCASINDRALVTTKLNTNPTQASRCLGCLLPNLHTRTGPTTAAFLLTFSNASLTDYAKFAFRKVSFASPAYK
ncbi:hypothetical protein CSKR_203207 [Clonorchis sinensis]|uniref:Uncharacterized protein n=1 Tax=Clonorchis sinensis TaxID=79923 RepID=A0A8T1M7G6_CLOSI|nr:hypothetical protein CSKR_203207 [Clonorchis sinensis]